MSVMDVACPFCGARPKEPCVRPGSPSAPMYPREPTHFSRFAEALAAAATEALRGDQ